MRRSADLLTQFLQIPVLKEMVLCSRIYEARPPVLTNALLILDESICQIPTSSGQSPYNTTLVISAILREDNAGDTLPW